MMEKYSRCFTFITLVLFAAICNADNLWSSRRKVGQYSTWCEEISADKDAFKGLSNYDCKSVLPDVEEAQQPSQIIQFGVGGKTVKASKKCDTRYMGDRLSSQEWSVCSNLDALRALEEMFDPQLGTRETQYFAIGMHGVVLKGAEYVTSNDSLHYNYRYDKRDEIGAFCKTQYPWQIGKHDWEAGGRSDRAKPWPTNRDIKDMIKNSIIERKLRKQKGFNVQKSPVTSLYIDAWDGTSKGHTVIRVDVNPDKGTFNVVQIDNKGRESDYKRPSVIQTGGSDADFFDPDLASKLIPIMKDGVMKELQSDDEFNKLFADKDDGVADSIKASEIGRDLGSDANGKVHDAVKKAAVDSKDVKKALEEFHLRFLSLPNSHFKWQQIQAYIDLVVSLQSWTLPPEKVLNKLVQEGSKIYHRNNTWKDLVEVPLSNSDSRYCLVKEKIGICGWCKCQPLHQTPKYEHEWLGASVEARAFDGQQEQNDVVGLLSFPVCKQCGKCYTYRRMGDDSDDVEFHVEPYEEAIDEHISQTHKIVAARNKMEDAILSIPDGEIVVPIKKMCSCKKRPETPNIVAFYERQKNEKVPWRYVCVDCFGLYSPNDLCNPIAK